MRAAIALVLLLFGISSAAPEPDYSSYAEGNLTIAGGDEAPSLVEIESSTGRGDRLPVPLPQPEPQPQHDATTVATLTFEAPAGTDVSAVQSGEVSLGDLCNAVYSSAQDNDLPIPFFANLLWQESRLRDDAVSRKGALGIAQFMPQTAAETGLDNPFDPLQAIPASARFLRDLRLEFGNLGFVAAAYNAGAHRVIQWLEHRASLPRETRGYVVQVTGLSVDDWRKMAVDDEALTFVRRLPCRSLPAFAGVEEAHAEQARLQEARLEQFKALAETDAAKHAVNGARHGAARAHGRGSKEPREAHRAGHGRRGEREAAGRPHTVRDKRNSV